MWNNSGGRDNVRVREGAVATPILLALGRHDALQVPFGSASLQRSPPPTFSVAVQYNCMTPGNTGTHLISYMDARPNHRIQPHIKRKATICSKAL